jgi:hypothetical protein
MLRFVFLLCVGVQRKHAKQMPLSRFDSKFCIIASKVSPVGAPSGLKTHAHSEQPQPRKRSWPIHTISRFIRGILHRGRSFDEGEVSEFDTSQEQAIVRKTCR